MTTWGWYYEQGSVQGEHASFDAAISEGVEDAAARSRLHALRVGVMRELTVAELLDEDDVVSMADDGITAWRIVELVGERAGDIIYDATAELGCSERDADEQLGAIMSRYVDRELAAPEIVAWAEDHINLDPCEYCDGHDPLPVEYVEGEWVPGGTQDSEPAGVIVYATETCPETGYVGWCWWALGRMGYAATYAAAKAAAEAVLHTALEGV